MSLEVIEVSISELQPSPYNPRKWSKHSRDSLRKSLEEFGLVDPILVNSAPSRFNRVIGGHFRLEIAKELGYKVVPVVYINIEDELREKELCLRLNQNTGDWDIDLLKDFDPTLLFDIGFTEEELSGIFDDHIELENDEYQKEDEKDEDIEVKVKPGDLYLLGNHRLICGDSTKLETIDSMFSLYGTTKEFKLADTIYTDPIFNISLDYDKGVSGKGSYGGTKVKNDAKSDEDYKEFLDSVVKNALKFTSKNAHLFFYCDQKYIWLLQQLYKENGIKNQRVALWIKNNFSLTPNIAFNKAYEACPYGTIGNPYLNPSQTKNIEILNKEISHGNRTIEDILDVIDIWLVKRLHTSEYIHATEKPVELHEKPLKRCTKAGDIVLDLFGGSGSTLIACEQLKRICYMVEIDPLFCQKIINRFEETIGTKAVLFNVKNND
jgi:DNA modification methylase